MAIYYAKEHTGDDYGAKPADVRAYLPFFPWNELGEAEQVDDLIELHLNLAKKRFAQRCKRADFRYHDSVEIAVDGTNDDRLAVGHLGFCPLIGTNPEALAIGGTACAVTRYQLERPGFIRYNPSATESGWEFPYATGVLPAGVKNVVATLTWGYDATYMATDEGQQIKFGQCLELAFRFLRLLGVSVYADEGIPPGWDSVRLGVDTVLSSRGGRYASQIETWKGLLAEIVGEHVNGMGIVMFAGENLPGSGGVR